MYERRGVKAAIRKGNVASSTTSRIAPVEDYNRLAAVLERLSNNFSRLELFAPEWKTTFAFPEIYISSFSSATIFILMSPRSRRVAHRAVEWPRTNLHATMEYLSSKQI